MKKSLFMKSACTVLMMLLMGIFGVQAQTVVFSENFAAFEGPNSTDIHNSLDTYTSVPGWTGDKVYRYSGKAKMGSTNGLGWLQTPAIDLSGGNGNFILEFDATAWVNDSTFFKVYVNNVPYTVSGLDNSNDYENLDHYTLQLSGGTSTTYIKFEGAQASRGRFFLDNVTITQTGGLPSTAQPTFSPAAGLYTSPINVEISSTTDNASIYYTLDGTTPTTSSTLYTSPISISQNTTVKAMATANGHANSLITSATYTFPETVANLAAFKALPNGSTSYMIDNDVTFVYGGGGYSYVKDASASLLLYGNFNIPNDFVEGDQIAHLMGTKSVYHDQVEMQNIVYEASQAPNTGTVVPTLLTFSELINNYNTYDAQLVTFENVTFPNGFSGSEVFVFQGNDSVKLFNRFSIDTTIAAGTTLNLTGLVAIHDNVIQIYPRYNQDLGGQEIVLTPSLTINEPTNGAVYSTLDTLHIGIDIQNFTLDTDGYLKVESNFLSAFIPGVEVMYLNQSLMNIIPLFPLSPMPAGEYTFTASLVDMDSNALSPAVSVSAAFTVVAPEQSAPTITAAGSEAEGDNTFYFNAEVTITADEDASIYYTTDGTEPTDASTLYTAPFNVTTTSTIKAIAVKPYYQNSNVSTLEVTITAPTVATPVFTPASGAYADSVAFSIACATEGAEIRYTLDGSNPTENSTLYTAPVTLTTTTTVIAKAFKTDWFASETATAVYTVSSEPILSVSTNALNFTSTQLTQQFTVSSANFSDPTITLSNTNTHFTVSPETVPTNTNTVVTVTFDGTEPTTASLHVLVGTVDEIVQLTATAQLPAPVLDPANGEDTLVTVTMSCSVAGATIHYTTDGTEPTAASAAYTMPVALNIPGTYTVKAIAVKADWENSEITTGTYIINEPPAPQPLDTVIYTVGFEAEEGFVASTVYNNTTVAFTGPDNMQWGTYYGTPSTNNAIVDAQSMQMRWYKANPDNIGYTYSNFDLRNVTHVTFTATNSNGLNVKVSHSVDGGSTYSAGETFALSSVAQNFDYVVDEAGAYDYVRLKFTIVVPDPIPTANSRVVIDSVVVYGILGITPTTVSAPVITPNEGIYYEPQTVSITCDDADAVIRYTTDGSVPTENSTIYSAPFTVSNTTTIKAKAWKTGMTPSFVSSATISFPEQVANIAAFKTNASNSAQQIMSDVTFVFRSEHYMFVEDNSAALLIYDNAGVITTTYNEGDVIEGGIFGSYQLYNGMVELIPSHNANAATGTPVTVMPTVATVSNVINDYATVYESKLVRLNDVEFIDAETFVQNGDTMSIRDRFNTVDLEISAGDHADVIGFVSYSTSYGYQIYPRDNNDIIISTLETVATPVIHMQRDGEFYRMTITCETEGASIYYSIDGTDPDESSYEYTSGVPFHLNVHYLVKAIAMKEGMNNSAIATYDYDPVGINQYELRDNLIVYPNPAVNNVTISAKDENLMIEKVELFNIYGQLMNTVTVNDSRTEVSVSALATGTYFAKVFTANGVVSMPIIRK